VRPLSGERIKEKRQSCPVGGIRVHGKNPAKESPFQTSSCDPFAAEPVAAPSPSEKWKSDFAPRQESNKDTPEDERFVYLLNHACVKRIESQKIVFAELPPLPNVLVVYRSPDERERSPERLNLHRRRLTQCPLLEGEENLRLLNYQNNLIEKMDNFVSLPNLVFLDLYSNLVSVIENLHTIPLLRVLMLGKNQITKLDNIEECPLLDVLDVHSNRIEKIENLEMLTQLRMLNLAGNIIRDVNPSSLPQSVTELNLRKNQISEIAVLDLPVLQRLFLSHNRITQFGHIEGVLSSESVLELSLDGNPVSSSGNYRDCILSRLSSSLRILDMRKVGDGERQHGFRSANKTLSPTKSGEKNGHSNNNNNTAQAPDDLKKTSPSCDRNYSANDFNLQPYLYNNNRHHSPQKHHSSSPKKPMKKLTGGFDTAVWSETKTEKERGTKLPPTTPSNLGVLTNETISDIEKREHEDANVDKEEKNANEEGEQLECLGAPAFGSLKEKDKIKEDDIQRLAEDRPMSVSTCSSSRHLSKRKKDGSTPSRQDVLIEIRTRWAQAVAEKRLPTTRYGYVKREEFTELFIFGWGLDALDKVEYQNSVSSIHFTYLTIDLIAKRVPQLQLKFEKVREITLAHNLIQNTSQLEVFLQIPNVTNMCILANPVCGDATFRMRVIKMLPHLQIINGYRVTEEERGRIRCLFGPLDDARLEMTPWKTMDSAPSSAIVMTVDDILGHALRVEEKIGQVITYFDDTMCDEFRRIWDDAIVHD